MITINVSENELGTLVKALQKHANRKQKNVERWTRLKEVGLIVPLEVADHFIEVDGKTAENCTKIIELLEMKKVSKSRWFHKIFRYVATL